MEILQFAILGLGTGGIFALIGQSIVAVNLGSGVLNFSAGALGMLGAYTFFELRGDALAGVLTHFLVMRPLTNRSQMAKVVATLGLMAGILQIVNLLSPDNGATRSETSPLPETAVNIGSEITVRADRLIIAGIAIAVTILLVVLQKRTRIGLATSAVA